MKVINYLLILFSFLIAGCSGSNNDALPSTNNNSTGNTQTTVNPAPVSGVYFIADKNAYRFDELYVAETGQTTPRKLSKLPDHGFDLKVIDFKLSPNNQWVAYSISNLVGGAGSELYIVPTIGGDPIYIAGDVLRQEPSVGPYEWAPDSTKLAFRTYNYVSAHNLFVTNPNGTEISKVSVDFTPLNNSTYQGVYDSYWSPDSQYIAIVYTGIFGVPHQYELYVVRPDGTEHQKLSQTLSANSLGVQAVTWSPDAQKLSFLADYNAWLDYDLYTVNRDSSAHTRLTDNTIVGKVFGGYQWSPNSNYLAYHASLNNGQTLEIYTVHPDGTNNIKVSGDATETQGAGGMTWSPDSSYLAYLADFGTDNIDELYVVRPDGTELNKVSGTLVANGYVTNLYTWSPDSSHLAYVADQDTENLFELYTVKPNGLDNIKISGAAVASLGQIEDFSWSPNSQRVGFRSFLLTNSNVELYSVNTDGTNLITNSGVLDLNRHVQSFLWSPDGSTIAYTADQDTDNILELYSVNSDATSLNKISGDPFLGGSIKKYQFEN